MVEETLRRLEREAQAGDPEALVGYARALEHAGRYDEALEALMPARAAGLVRAALARWPGWTHEDGDSGRTRCVDLRPLYAEPRLQWVRPEEREPTSLDRPTPLLANPIAAVTYRHPTTISVLDPDSGEVHATTEVRGNPIPLSLAGEALLVHAAHVQQMRAIDMWADVDLWQLPLALRRGELVLRSLEDPARGAAGAAAWSPELPEPLRQHHAYGGISAGPGWILAWGPLRPEEAPRSSFFLGDSVSARVAGGRLLVNKHTNNLGEARHAAFDLETRQLLWTAAGTVRCADGEGVLVSHLNDLLQLRDVRGELVWERRGLGGLALTPDLVLARRLDGRQAVALERATAEERFGLGRGLRACAAVRDVIYLAQDTRLRALDAGRGEVLWRLDTRRLVEDLGLARPARAAELASLAPLSGRLLVKGRDGSVLALGE